MKPGIQKWATNANYAAGPDAGQPTKAELAVGLVQDGYYSQRAVAPDFWNMFRWRLSERIDNLGQARLKNMSAKITPAVAGWAFAGGPLYTAFTGVYSDLALVTRDNEVHTGICNSLLGVPAIEGFVSRRGGEDWANAPLLVASPTFIPADICAAYPIAGVSGGGWAMAGPDVGLPGLYFTARGSVLEAAWDPTLGRFYYGLDTSYKELGADVWCAYEGITPAVRRAVALGGALLPSAGLGALVPGIVGVIRYSHHEAGKLYPSDAGNDVWLLATAGGGVGLGNIATSIDNGLNFAIVNAAAPSICNTRSLSYSSWGARWGMLETTATYPTFSYSDDNGITWTSLADPFGFTALNYNAVNSVPNSKLVCDGYGHWMAAMETSNVLGNLDFEVFYSPDNGLTWARCYPPIPTVINLTSAGAAYGHDLWYADGAFWYVICFDDGAGNDVYYVFSTLRTAE